MDPIFSRSPDSEIPPIITPILHNYRNVRKNINTITLDKQLGKGSFGTVYLCHDENNNKLAVKCIKTKDYGVPSLSEASIMSVIRHPNISMALKIHATPQKLYIVQELAISDLRVYRLNNNISEDLCCEWIHMMLQGVSCLHRYNIIHGDIKAGNILVYSGNRIKISDFTLSTDEKWPNKHKPCTPTHRPLEVWLGYEWNKSVDIWSLGCTIFELIYGKSLFISQGTDQSINAIIDWYNYLPVKHKHYELNTKHRVCCFHYSFNLPDSFNTSIHINKLILSMLMVNSKRPSIEVFLNNALFSSYSIIPSTIITSTPTFLPIKKETKIRKYLSKFNKDSISLELAYDLYSRLIGLINVDDKIKMVTCSWISHKIIKRQNIALNILPFELYEILQMERTICDHLSYRLWCKSPRVIFRENKTIKSF